MKSSISSKKFHSVDNSLKSNTKNRRSLMQKALYQNSTYGIRKLQLNIYSRQKDMQVTVTSI